MRVATIHISADGADVGNESGWVQVQAERCGDLTVVALVKRRVRITLRAALTSLKANRTPPLMRKGAERC